MAHHDLKDFRKRIDEIDKNLVRVFEQRMAIVSEVAEYKRKNGIKILDDKREKEVINRVVSLLENKNLEKYLSIFMDDFMTLCRQYQIDQNNGERIRMDQNAKTPASIDNGFEFQTSNEAASPTQAPISGSTERVHSVMKNESLSGTIIGHYGSPGSYSEEAAVKYFGSSTSRKPYRTFDEVVSALISEEIDFAVLPIENSTTGIITAVVDLIRDHPIYIVGEQVCRIRHNLLALPGSKLTDIKTVYSHSQGFEQSSRFLKNYPWDQIAYGSTASNAEKVSALGDTTKAAIASSRCAEVYGLEILVPDIHDNKNNDTRFIIVGRELMVNSTSDKISIVMDITHKPGALYNVLRLFNERNINIMKIESRPVVERPWEYLFFFDFEGNLRDERVKNLLASLENISHLFRLLGNYRNSQRSVS